MAALELGRCKVTSTQNISISELRHLVDTEQNRHSWCVGSLHETNVVKKQHEPNKWARSF
jgi:DNA-binding transcriptional regulator GbsR (MarR family)